MRAKLDYKRKHEVVTVRLDKDLAQQLDSLTERAKLSKSDVIRSLIKEEARKEAIA